MIGERVRDKIAASKRKGIWVGGPVPLGYRVRRQEARRGARGGGGGPHHLYPLSRAWLHGRPDRGPRPARYPHQDNSACRRQGTGRHPFRDRCTCPSAQEPLLHRRNRLSGRDPSPAEHQPIIDRELFEAVQAKLAENAVGRQARLRGSPAILTGRIFDDRGNRMSPSHTNKLGVRYRYYVSHAILQQRQNEVGSVGRVPAAEIEKLVLEGVRSHPASGDEAEGASAIADRDLIVQRVQAVTIKPRGWKSGSSAAGRPSDDTCTLDHDSHPDSLPTTIITLPWTRSGFHRRQGHPSFAFCSKARTEVREPGCPARRHRQGQAMDRRPSARPNCIVRGHRKARRPGRTAYTPVGPPRLRIAPDHLGDRRRHRPCRSHRHRSRPGLAVLLG